MIADRDYCAAWLKYLFGDVADLPAFVRWSWWTPAGRGPLTRACPVDRLDEAADAMGALSDQGCAVYLRQTLTATPPVHEHDRGGADVPAWLTHLWCDLDIAGPRHKRTAGAGLLPLPATIDEAEAIADGLAPMSAVLASGGGAYGVWKLDEPLDVRDGEVRHRAQRVVSRFATALTAAGADRGCHVDGVGDLARLLRPAGVLSYKGMATDAPMVTVRRGWVLGAGPYTFGELAAVAAERAPTETTDHHRVTTTTASTGGELNVLDAIGSAWTLGGVLASDPRFGPWTHVSRLDSRGDFEHWNRAGSENAYSIKRNTTTGVVIVWSDTVAAGIGVNGGDGLTLPDFAARLFGCSLSELSIAVLRRARQLRREVAA